MTGLVVAGVAENRRGAAMDRRRVVLAPTEAVGAVGAAGIVTGEVAIGVTAGEGKGMDMIQKAHTASRIRATLSATRATYLYPPLFWAVARHPRIAAKFPCTHAPQSGQGCSLPQA